MASVEDAPETLDACGAALTRERAARRTNEARAEALSRALAAFRTEDREYFDDADALRSTLDTVKTVLEAKEQAVKEVTRRLRVLQMVATLVVAACGAYEGALREPAEWRRLAREAETAATERERKAAIAKDRFGAIEEGGANPRSLDAAAAAEVLQWECPVQWVRVDPEGEWLAEVRVPVAQHGLEGMVTAQLTKERPADVAAQAAAVARNVVPKQAAPAQPSSSACLA